MFTTYVYRNFSPGFLGVLFLLIACNTEDPFPLDPVRGITPADNGNAGNGADLEIFVSEQFENDNIAAYRAVVFKASNGTLSLTEANSSPYFESASPDDIFPIQGITFTQDSRDTDGDLLTEDVEYKVGVLSIPADSKTFSTSLLVAEESITLKQNNLISNFTNEFPGFENAFSPGAGSLTLNAQGDVIMGSYNMVGVLSEDDSEVFPVYQMSNSGTINLWNGPHRMLGGNTRDQDGNVYQSILNYARVLKIDADGRASTIVLNNFSVEGNDGVYVNDNQELFVVNPESRTILKWNLETNENEIFANIPENARGITGDETGNLYVSHNIERGLISKITPEGVVSEFAEIPTAIPENFPADIYIMWLGYLTYHEDAIYVASTGDSRIYKVTLDGDVTVFAGSGSRGIPRGGALTADINRPIGITFSEDGSKLLISGSTDTQPQHTHASAPARIWELSIVE
ncbi:MAG: hypothetical protein R8G66_04625 [Cytophagales bacterium]|nr:hypothetical protein [Cytophagales bacterium]